MSQLWTMEHVSPGTLEPRQISPLLIAQSLNSAISSKKNRTGIASGYII